MGFCHWIETCLKIDQYMLPWFDDHMSSGYRLNIGKAVSRMVNALREKRIGKNARTIQEIYQLSF